MSKKEETIVSLKQEDRDLLRSAINAANKINDWKPPTLSVESKNEGQKNVPKGHTDEHPSHTIEEAVDCPNCYPKVKKLVMKKEWEERKDNPLECVNCGTRVKEDEDECPTCGGTEADTR